MSASGHSRRFGPLTFTSGLPPTTDVPGPGWLVSKVPLAEVRTLLIRSRHLVSTRKKCRCYGRVQRSGVRRRARRGRRSPSVPYLNNASVRRHDATPNVASPKEAVLGSECTWPQLLSCARPWWADV